MPFNSNIHVNKPLTNLSVRYSNDNFIAELVFPRVQVKHESDVYYVYDGENLKRTVSLRANGAESNQVEHDYSTSSYVLEEHALKELITKRDRDNADSPLNLDIDANENLNEKISIDEEIRTMQVCFTTTTWSNNATVGSASAWDTSTSNPIADVLTATASILLNGRVMPNYGVMGWEPFKVLKVNSVTVDRLKITQDKVVTKNLIATLFDLDQLLIGTASYDANPKGVAPSNTFIWGKDLLVYHKAQAKLKTKGAGVILRIKGVRQTKKWHEDKLNGDFIEVSTFSLPRAVATSSAYLLKQVVK